MKLKQRLYSNIDVTKIDNSHVKANQYVVSSDNPDRWDKMIEDATGNSREVHETQFKEMFDKIQRYQMFHPPIANNTVNNYDVVTKKEKEVQKKVQSDRRKDISVQSKRRNNKGRRSNS